MSEMAIWTLLPIACGVKTAEGQVKAVGENEAMESIVLGAGANA